MNEERTLISAAEADKLLACADGTAALLYLQIRRAGGFSLSAAARVLKRSEAEVALAADTLRRLGLMEQVQPPLPKKEIPEYTGADIVSRAGDDSAFACIVAEAERILGRVLSSNDLKILLGIYDHLGLPADAMLLLLHHCVEEYQEKNGPGRLPTMRAIEKEGWFWAEQEIVTPEAAEEHIRRSKEARQEIGRIREVLQIRGRDLTPSEQRYIAAWQAMGFGPAALAVAYDRTVSSTGKLAWSYMDKILRSWDEKRLYTPAEIEAGDARRGSRPPVPTGARETPAASDSEKLEKMRKMVEHMKNRSGGEG